MGFLIGKKEVVQNFRKLRSQIDYGTFLPVQYGAVAALTGSYIYNGAAGENRCFVYSRKQLWKTGKKTCTICSGTSCG